MSNMKTSFLPLSQRLKDDFLQEWSYNIQNSSKLVLYKQFKLIDLEVPIDPPAPSQGFL